MHIQKIAGQSQSVISETRESVGNGFKKPSQKQLENFREWRDSGALDSLLIEVEMGAGLTNAVKASGKCYDTFKGYMTLAGKDFDEFRLLVQSSLSKCAGLCEQTIAVKSPHLWLTQGPGRLLEDNIWLADETTSNNSVADDKTIDNTPTQADVLQSFKVARELGLDINALVDGGLSGIETTADNVFDSIGDINNDVNHSANNNSIANDNHRRNDEGEHDAGDRPLGDRDSGVGVLTTPIDIKNDSQLTPPTHDKNLTPPLNNKFHSDQLTPNNTNNTAILDILTKNNTKTVKNTNDIWSLTSIPNQRGVSENIFEDSVDLGDDLGHNTKSPATDSLEQGVDKSQKRPVRSFSPLQVLIFKEKTVAIAKLLLRKKRGKK